MLLRTFYLTIEKESNMRILLLSSFIAIASASNLIAEDIDDAIQRAVLGATVKITISTTLSPDSITSGGSGTVIFNDTHVGENGVMRRVVIATAEHVLVKSLFAEQDLDGVVTTRDISLHHFTSYIRDMTGQIRARELFTPGASPQIASYKIHRYASVDAAFIVIDIKPGCQWLSNVTAVEVAGTPIASRLRIGSDLLVAGCPIMVDPVIFRNRLIQRNLTTLAFRNPGKFIGHLVSRVFTSGNSGGGVYTHDGKFIGIVTLRIGEDFGAFTGIEHILPFAILDRDVMLLMNP
jgi:hypothetical protein